MRITNSGDFRYCRWMTTHDTTPGANIRDTTPIQWFQDSMSLIRNDLLQGKTLSGCNDCYVMEQYGKISGRQRQLLKIGVREEYFEKSMQSSAWRREFDYSAEHQGNTQQWPQDWQIDLGNYCNSACVFCDPSFSSKLAWEFKKIGLTSSVPPRAWCDDPVLLDKFIAILTSSPRLRYLHFIGGETLITPAFAKILRALIQSNLHQQVTVGFTTNLTTWDETVVDLLCEFQEINLGMSIECVDPLNDYVRYGGKLDETLSILERWIQLGRTQKWLMQIRSTPTVLSVWHLDSLYRYALTHEISIESCNFLDRPEFMRPSVLPMLQRQQIIDKLQRILQEYDLKPDSGDSPVNTRSPEFFRSYLARDIQSYIGYLNYQPDESYKLPDLVNFLKKLETNRKNRILDYLPEYETILRSAGY